MQFEIKITGDLSDSKMVALINALGGVTTPSESAVQKTDTSVKELKTAVKEQKQKIEATKEVAEPQSDPNVGKQTEVTDMTPSHTFEEVRAKAVTISKAGKKEEVQAALKKLGREKTPELTPDQYDEFWELLMQIK